MSKPIHLVRWLTVSQLQKKFLTCQKTKEARRWQLLWLVASGTSLPEAADTVAYCYRQAHRIVSAYNKLGPTSVSQSKRDVRHLKARSLLTPEQQRKLKRAIAKGHAPDGGLWTGPKVAEWISKECGREVAPQRGWDYLQKLGFALRRPRPRHVETNTATQEKFKKNSRAWQPSGKKNSPISRYRRGAKTNTESGSNQF